MNNDAASLDAPGLKALVIEEAKALLIHATPEELARLNIETIDPDHVKKCIYGQMTGGCFSLRAGQLLSLCAATFSEDLHYFAPVLPIQFLPIGGSDRFFSAIEFYINIAAANRANLVAFLRGERTELTPEGL